MPRRVLLTRRDWLKVSALAGGGLALGLQIPPRGQAATWRPPETRFSPNAWIRIHGDGRIQLLVARSEMGQGVMTALPMLLAEELEVPLSRVEARFAPAHPDYVNRLLGQQATGGSTSVREAWTPLREAGAAVREMLIEAAAITWGVPVSECRAANARVRHQDDERSLGYGQLATLAASLPLPESVLLKGPSEWHLIGTERPRLDTPTRSPGGHASGWTCACPGCSSRAWSAARSSAASCAATTPMGPRPPRGVLVVLEITGGVAVIARDTWSALKGRRALNIEWSPAGNGGLDTDRIRARFRAGLGKRGALAREQRGRLGRPGDHQHPGGGGVRGPLPGPRLHGAHELHRRRRAPTIAPSMCPPRPRPGWWRPPGASRACPRRRISVHTTFLGGGFGRRGEQDFVADAVELSHRLRRPVQVLWTREDDIRHDFYRPMTLNRLRGGIDESGNLVAWFHRIVGPSILGRVRPPAIRGGIDPTSVDGAANLPYAIPNLRVEYRRADTPVPVGFWRSVGNSQNTYVTECFLDELARAAGKEPLTLRRTLLAQSPRHLGVLELAARHAGWGQPPPEGRSRGIAVAESFGSFVAQVAEISIAGGQVRVHRVVCAVDCGRVVNPDTVRAQMQSGIAFGLTAALKGSISIAEGRVQEGNFDDYPLLRADEMPAIDVYVVASDAEPGGVGEPGTPPIAPAVANAVFAATGRPVRRLPIRLEPAAASGA
jgi:isoquinoline 1-oxidoreductase subunit beta